VYGTWEVDGPFSRTFALDNVVKSALLSSLDNKFRSLITPDANAVRRPSDSFNYAPPNVNVGAQTPPPPPPSPPSPPSPLAIDTDTTPVNPFATPVNPFATPVNPFAAQTPPGQSRTSDIIKEAFNVSEGDCRYSFGYSRHRQGKITQAKRELARQIKIGDLESQIEDVEHQLRRMMMRRRERAKVKTAGDQRLAMIASIERQINTVQYEMRALMKKKQDAKKPRYCYNQRTKVKTGGDQRRAMFAPVQRQFNAEYDMRGVMKKKQEAIKPRYYHY
jgi:hypothetical protein